MTTQILPLLTTDDLIGLPDDGSHYELIDGELYVSRAPHISHQFVLAKLLQAVMNYLDQNPVGQIVPEAGVIFDKHNAVIPDLAFMTNETYQEIVSGGKMHAAPDLAIEILSYGAEQEARDRSLKLRLYGQRGVREYWIVDSRAKTIEIYHRTRQGLALASTLNETDVLTTELLPGFELQMTKVFDV
ncbi:MAG: Uma2 family endonuclease [Pyrinomonadaceae bacterium]|nr:Uma2 family endonuclease [Pyrinomonadaceae bacterium]